MGLDMTNILTQYIWGGFSIDEDNWEILFFIFLGILNPLNFRSLVFYFCVFSLYLPYLTSKFYSELNLVWTI